MKSQSNRKKIVDFLLEVYFRAGAIFFNQSLVVLKAGQSIEMTCRFKKGLLDCCVDFRYTTVISDAIFISCNWNWKKLKERHNLTLPYNFLLCQWMLTRNQKWVWLEKRKKCPRCLMTSISAMYDYLKYNTVKSKSVTDKIFCDKVAREWTIWWGQKSFLNSAGFFSYFYLLQHWSMR